MTAPRVTIGERHQGDEAVNPAWSAVLVVGLALLATGSTDILLAWVPPRFGNPEWEFGTISATLNNMPVPSMGLALVLAYAAAAGKRGLLAAVAAWSIVVTLCLAVSAVFYALDVPLALRAVTEPVPRNALRAGIIKAVVSLIAYAGVHVAFAVMAIRNIRQN
jgi:hypothetical protein